jgi:hypothetical protein
VKKRKWRAEIGYEAKNIRRDRTARQKEIQEKLA